MLSLLFSLILVFLIFSGLLFGLRGLIRFGSFSYRSMSPFECGFQRVGSVCPSFTLHSYLILLVFLIFDLELCMLLGFLLVRGSTLWLFYVYVLFIFVTYYVEFHRGSFTWVF